MKQKRNVDQKCSGRKFVVFYRLWVTICTTKIGRRSTFDILNVSLPFGTHVLSVHMNASLTVESIIV